MGRFDLAKSNLASFLKKNNGFTLIELIVVIGVMAVIATIGMAALDPLSQYQKSTDARKKSDLSQIQKALEEYYEDNGEYPGLVAANNEYYIMNSDANGSAVIWGTSWQPYMNVLPKPPDQTKYIYFVDEGSRRQAYYLYANLSRGGKDPQACNPEGTDCQSAVYNSVIGLCGGPCNYGVTSPNVNP